MISAETLPFPLAGLDESGRGCLAGPVVGAAVVLPEIYHLPGLQDSKQLSPAQRNHFAKEIKSQALSWSLGLAWPREIEKINILQASLLAMCRALNNLKIEPAYALIDGNQTLPVEMPQQCIEKGDSLVSVISAASIIAKTFRDHLMFHLHKRYPGYGLDRNKGYATKHHLKSLKKLGPCPIHRRTYKGVREHITERLMWLPGT